MDASNKITVVLADDHTVIREGLRMLLDTAGDIRVVAEADNGLEAVRLAKELEPDVVVLDLAMPEMSGPEVLDQLARRAVLPPTIIITSDGLSSGLARALRAGAVDYFVKPVDPDRLVASVREALDLDQRRRTVSRAASAHR